MERSKQPLLLSTTQKKGRLTTMTHVLNYALRKVSEEVDQKGSSVTEEKLDSISTPKALHAAAADGGDDERDY